MFAFVFSDLHASYKNLKNIEGFLVKSPSCRRRGQGWWEGGSGSNDIKLLIFAGDLVNMGEPVGFVEEFLKVIDKVQLPLMWVPGNNDFGRAYHKLNARIKSLEGRVAELSVISTHSEPTVGWIEEGEKSHDKQQKVLRFTGVGGSPASWAGQYAGENLIDKKLISGSIFVSHVPPPGILVMNRADCPLPSPTKIFKDSPLLHICGHQHSRWGCGYLGSTKVINPGSAADGRYAILDLESLRVEFERF